MIYDGTPKQTDNGEYFLKISKDDKKKMLIQLNKIKVLDSSGDLQMEITSDKDMKKLADIDTVNIQVAKDNSESWFGKKLTDTALERSYVFSRNSLPVRLSMRQRYSTIRKNLSISRH